MRNISEVEILHAIESGKFSELEEMCEIMGVETLIKFLHIYQGCSPYIPLIKTIQKESQPEQIYTDYLQGISFEQLARKYKLTKKTIYNIVGKKRQEKCSMAK